MNRARAIHYYQDLCRRFDDSNHDQGRARQDTQLEIFVFMEIAKLMARVGEMEHRWDIMRRLSPEKEVLKADD